MDRYIDISNQRFGMLTAKHIDRSRNSDHTYWICECDCGNIKSIQRNALISGKTISCGCYSKKINSTLNGLSIKYKRIYQIYSGMLARCFNPKCISYKYYGAKGRTVCNEWKNSFETFLNWSLNNGYADNLTIDRINNEGNYEPDNCRWVDMRTQQNNKSHGQGVVMITNNGETHHLAEWARIKNIPYQVVKDRRKLAKQRGITLSFDELFAPKKFNRSPNVHPKSKVV